MDHETGKVVGIEIADEMRQSYIDYAMSVISSRALPDVRDGLKPVHRRILYAMHEAGNNADKPHRKSAKTVGEVIGNYHPHSDAAVYDAMVRLAQDFSMRYPLIDGHGNFGCFTGDTKIRLVDGTEKSFAELAKKGPDARFYVYAVDETGRIVVAEGRNARVTRRQAELMRVVLDNGEVIRCTPDHRFMLRDGTYKEAQHLTAADSLMSGYFHEAPVRQGSAKYLRVRQTDGSYSFVHHLADEFNVRNGRARHVSGGFVRHHRAKIHGQWKDPAFRQAQTTAVQRSNRKRLQENPALMSELAQKAAVSLSAKWKDRNYKQRVMRTRIAGYVSRLLREQGTVTAESFEAGRDENWIPRFETAMSYFKSMDDLITAGREYNHRVVEVQITADREDVYDITVDRFHNFLLSAGVFVHNSSDGDPAAAMRYCVTGDTLVVTDRGLARIEDLSPDGAEDVRLQVLSVNGDVNTASKWFNCGAFPTKRVQTRNGYEVTGTMNHPLLTWVADAGGRPVLAWKLVEDIRPGDWLVLDRSQRLWPSERVDLTPYHPQIRGKSGAELHEAPSLLHEDLAFLMGALTAEGTFRPKGIELAHVPGELAEAFAAVWQRVFPSCQLHVCERQAVGYERSPYLRMQVVSSHAVQLLHNLGLREEPGGREVPAVILRSPKAVAAAFLAGLFEGDGAVEPSGRSLPRVTLVSKNPTLLRQVQTLLLRFGIVSKRGTDAKRRMQRLMITGETDLRTFAEQIGFLSATKRAALARVREAHSGSALSPTDTFAPYLFEQVAVVQDAGEQPVYSLRVDSNCHSFVANGFINHNTEARLSRIGMEMLTDIEKETVDFTPNYDEQTEEPTVLPARLPNLLVNGADGIAVGMATKIPPHNLREVIDGVAYLIDHPGATNADLMKIVKGPDFPTGAYILGRKGIEDAYTTGRGSLLLRAKAQIEETRSGKFRIVVTELPYQTVKSRLLERIADLVRDKKLDGITDLRDESDRKGIRVVIELARTANPQVVLNQLYKETPLQQSYGIIFLALVNGRPKVLTLRDGLSYYLEYQKEIITRRTRFELAKAEARAHILEGLRIALDNIDAVIALIRASRTTADAQQGLMTEFGLSEKQADAILDMRLQRLTGLERDKIEEEYAELLKTIEYLRAVLANEAMVYNIVRTELLAIRERFGDERRTQILLEEGEFQVEDLIAEEDVFITMTHAGYIKRMPIDTYRSQHRGGRGVAGITTKEEDFVEHIFIASTHHTLLFFTNRGRVYRQKVYEVPEASRTARGTAVVNLIQVEQGELVNSVLAVKEFDDEHFVTMVTRNGVVKKTNLSEMDTNRRGGLIAITLDEGDELIATKLTRGDQELLIATRRGLAIRFPEEDVRAMGRTARGVIGIRLEPDDIVVGAELAVEGADLLVITANGFGKRTPVSEFRLQGRGGKGIRALRVTPKTGTVAAVKTVRPGNEVMITTSKGVIIRQPVDGISVQGRDTQGVTLIRLDEGDQVMAVAQVVSKDE